MSCIAKYQSHFFNLVDGN